MPQSAPAESDWDLPPVPVQGGVSDHAPAPLPQWTGDKAELLTAFAKWFRDEDLPETPDADLVKFIHSCDYDLDKAKQCAKDFHYSRREVPQLFSGWDLNLPNMKSILDVLLIAILPRKTPKNCRIVVSSLQTSDTTNYIIDDVTRITLMMMESIFITEPTIDGLILIHDLNLVTFSHFVKMAWNMNRKMKPYFQAGLPLKRDKVHLMNCSAFIDKGLMLVKSFGRQEDWDRLRVHRGDFTNLHSEIPLECLPSDLGGTLPPLIDLHHMTQKRLESFQDIFQKQQLLLF